MKEKRETDCERERERKERCWKEKSLTDFRYASTKTWKWKLLSWFFYVISFSEKEMAFKFSGIYMLSFSFCYFSLTSISFSLSLLDKTVKASQERQRGVWNRGHNYGALNQPLTFTTFLLFLVAWSDPETDFPNLFHAIKIKTVCGFLSIYFSMLFQTNIISVFNLWFMAGVSMGFRIFILFCFYFC